MIGAVFQCGFHCRQKSPLPPFTKGGYARIPPFDKGGQGGFYAQNHVHSGKARRRRYAYRG